MSPIPAVTTGAGLVQIMSLSWGDVMAASLEMTLNEGSFRAIR
jgi:hypothetical protein